MGDAPAMLSNNLHRGEILDHRKLGRIDSAHVIARAKPHQRPADGQSSLLVLDVHCIAIQVDKELKHIRNLKMVYWGWNMSHKAA
jgi:hypothetical protein